MNQGKICVSVCAETSREMIEKIVAARLVADIVEVRFDCLPPAEIDVLLGWLRDSGSERPVVFTFRSREQGGQRELTFTDRLKFWEKVMAEPLDRSVIDIEAESRLAVAIQTNHIPRIISHHDFAGVPDDLAALFDGIAAAFDPDIVKIAITATDIADTIEIWKLIERARDASKQIIPIAMGEAGKWTRILGPAHGAFLTYTSLDAGGETAPGQVTAKQLVELYRAKELDRATKVYGILGDPVSQSLSTFMHNPAFVSEGVNAVFIPFLVKDIRAFMHRMVRPQTREIELNFGGFSVTMPHKQTIMEHLDAIDPTAERIGAVNTVKIDEGRLTGYNTDAHGFITPLRSRFGEVKGAKAAVFGAGGAARACVYSLQQEGADVEVFVRNVDKARPFAEEFGVRLFEIDEVRDGKLMADILVDTTPIGMSGTDQSLFTADELKGVKFVYDLVTKPYDTPIIQEAKKANIPAIGGMEMLIAQGAKQFELWTGKPAPAAQMRNDILARFAELNK